MCDIAGDRLLAQPHDGAFAELFFDLAERQVECFGFDFLRHRILPTRDLFIALRILPQTHADSSESRRRRCPQGC